MHTEINFHQSKVWYTNSWCTPIIKHSVSGNWFGVHQHFSVYTVRTFQSKPGHSKVNLECLISHSINTNNWVWCYKPLQQVKTPYAMYFKLRVLIKNRIGHGMAWMQSKDLVTMSLDWPWIFRSSMQRKIALPAMQHFLDVPVIITLHIVRKQIVQIIPTSVRQKRFKSHWFTQINLGTWLYVLVLLSMVALKCKSYSTIIIISRKSAAQNFYHSFALVSLPSWMY